MLKSYKYIDYVHCLLHEFVIAFFRRTEFETADFDLSFFEPDFQNIVNRHRKVLKNRFKEIYEIINDKTKFTQTQRSQLCQQIIESNDIENICKGTFKPSTVNQLPTELRDLLKGLFDDLYDQI